MLGCSAVKIGRTRNFGVRCGFIERRAGPGEGVCIVMLS